MDFVNNIWSKTGLKKEEDPAVTTSDAAAADGKGDGKVEASRKESASDEVTAPDGENKEATGNLGFMSNFIKNPFKGSDSGERKASVASDSSPKESESPSSKSFVSNIFKNPFSKGSNGEGGSSDRKASQAEPNEEDKVETTAPSEGEEGADGVGQKAIDSAKNFGGFLYSVANKAGQTVTATAKQLKHTVESNSLLADLNKEQQEFVKEHGGNMEAVDPPWIGCDNQDEMKGEIISLSQDKRNFVRNPPAGVEFPFDLQSSLPVALGILKEDTNLAKMRFEIVPKLVNEETFWRNYFYRVSLLKQSTQANSLKGKQCKGKGWGSTSSSEAEGPDEMSPTSEQPEFLNDSTRGLDMDTDEDTNQPKADDKKWEEELSKDLQEFEVVGESDELNDEDLDKDLAELM